MSGVLASAAGRPPSRPAGHPIVVVNPFPGTDLVASVRERLDAAATVVAAADDGPLPDGPLVLLTGTRVAGEDWRARLAATEWVHFLSTGIDGFDLDWLDGRLVTNSRGAHAVPIAEYAVAAILAAAKRLPELWATNRLGDVIERPLASLAGATVGLVGLGTINVEVARRLQAFGTTVLAVRRTPGRLPELPEVEIVPSVAELLGRSDHVVIAAPLTPATHHLIGTEALAAAKPGLHLVNVARGGLVDQDALLAALTDGVVGRATLDVTEPEPLPDDHPLRAHPHVWISPHASWSGGDPAGDRAVELFVANFVRWRRGEALAGAVDVAEGY
jgi:phosphoglycerate dehydrogenase-like enzyme